MGMRDHIPSVRRKDAGIGKTGRKAETQIASKLKARLRPNSGAMASAKGDMVLDDFLIEAKSTVHDSISIKYEWLGKISSEAMAVRKVPALAVAFTWPDGRAVSFGEWVMIPLTAFNDLVESSEKLACLETETFGDGQDQ